MEHSGKRVTGQLLSVLFRVVLTGVPVGIFYFTYRHFYEEATFWSKGNYLFILLYVFVLALFLSMYGGYNIRNYRTRELVFSFVIGSLMANAIMYFVMALIARMLLNPLYIGVATVAQWMVEVLLYILARLLEPRINPDLGTLYICGTGEKDSITQEKFDSRRTRFSIRAVISADVPRQELMDAMDRYEAVVAGDIDEQLRRELMGYCFRQKKAFLMMPAMTDVMVNSAEKIIMGDELLFVVNTTGFTPGFRIAKRALDLVAAVCGLLVLSPVLLVTAACIKLYDGGPVLYRQLRLTKDGREFQVLKFRSMIVNAEAGTGAVLAGKSDSRITPIGQLIRATRIDELPQLWNILRGDMTLVGPRPERPEFYEKYCAEYPEFAYRLKVTAGLTGYAQLYGKYNTTFMDKARLDMYYIQRASFLRDLQLLFYTLKIIFVKDSTEGVAGSSAVDKEQVSYDDAADQHSNTGV